MEVRRSRRNFLQVSSQAVIQAPIILGLGSESGKAQPSLRRPGDPFLKLSCNAYSFNQLLTSGQMDLMGLLDFCAGLGLDAVDLTGYYFPKYPEAPAQQYLFEVKRRAFVLGLDISGTGVRNDFTVPDAEKRKADVALVKLWIEVAARMGAPCLRVFAGHALPPTVSRSQLLEWVVEGLAECAQYGGRFGVMVVLQNHAAFIKSADQMLEVLGRVNSEWLGANLDIGSFRTADPYAEIARVAPHAVTWQIKEEVYFEEQSRATDFPKLLQIIRSSGYRGYLPLETLGGGDPRQKFPELLRRVQEALKTS